MRMNIELSFPVYNRAQARDLNVKVSASCNDINFEESLDALIQNVSKIEGLNDLHYKIFAAKKELRSLQLQIDQKKNEWNRLATFLKAQGIADLNPLEIVPDLERLSALPPAKYENQEIEDIPFDEGISDEEDIADADQDNSDGF